MQFFHRGPQLLIIIGIHRVDPGKDHRLDILKPFDGLPAGTFHVGDRIPHLHLAGVLDPGDDITHIACAQHLARLVLHFQHSDLIRHVIPARSHELHMIALTEFAVEDLEIRINTTERVVYGVEDQCLQRRRRIALRRRHLADDLLQDTLHTHARLAAGLEDLLTAAPHQVDDLVLHLFGHGIGQVHLVEHRDDLQIVLDGQVKV